MKLSSLIVILITMVSFFANAQTQLRILDQARELDRIRSMELDLIKKEIAEIEAKKKLGNDRYTSMFRKELGSDLDIAETSLRVLMNDPAKGTRFSNQQISCENQLKAAVAILNFEMRHPGYLQGKHGNPYWAQYQSVKELFNKLSNKYEFFFNSSASQRSSKGSK